MARRASMSVTGKAKMTPVSPTGDAQRSGGAAKSGQYPGRRQSEGEAEGNEMDQLAPATSVRGVDPALAGSYVHTAKSLSQGAAVGKDQVKNPNEPLAAAYPGGQYPGVPVTITYGEGFDGVADPGGNLAGATEKPQAREGGTGAIGGQYPGVSQAIEGLAGAMAASDETRSILDNEGKNINLRDVVEGGPDDNSGTN